MATKIDSIGLCENNDGSIKKSMDMFKLAAEPCIQGSSLKKEDIGLLVSVAVYRDQYFCEPSFSSFVQNELKINHDKVDSSGPKTLSLDVLNGSIGFLNACQLSHAMLASGKVKAAILLSSDAVDENISDKGSSPGFHPCGAAMILTSGTDDSGFKSFYSRTFTDKQHAVSSYFFHDTDKKMKLFLDRDQNFEDIYIDAAYIAAAEFLREKNMGLNDFDMIIPSQISKGFIAKLASVLGVDPQKMIDVTKDADLFNASIPFAMDHVFKNNADLKGKRVLIINVASGIQVGCAIYDF